MANFLYNTAALEIANGTLDLEADTIKIMLVNTDNYTADRDDDVVDDGSSTDPETAEITATNYTRGHAGAGRLTLSASNTVWAVDKTNDRAELDTDNFLWTALGGAVNDDVDAAIIIKEDGSDDTSTRLIAYIDTSTGSPPLPFTTTGSNFTLTVNVEGLIHLKTTA
jgi:hypothetical protein